MRKSFLFCSLFFVACGQHADVPHEQVDRVGMPLLSQIFLTTNTNMMVFNTIEPYEDLQVQGRDVQTEYKANMAKYVTAATAAGLTPLSVSAATDIFFPDVLRIDTNQTSGFAMSTATTELGNIRLTGGRRIEDDVVDIMLSFILGSDTTGAAVSDNVSYDGAGAGSGLQGHNTLLPSFPYLAAPQ